jgi:WD40 repeat protein
MKTNDNLVSNDVSNIILNFSSMVKNFGFMEKDWENKKEKFENKINDLNIEIKTNEILNMDLLKRIRMLEYAIKEEKNKNKKNNINNNINENNNDNNLNKNNYNDDLIFNENEIKYLRENKSNLYNILNSIGIDENLCDDLFNDFEINKIELESFIKQNLEKKLLNNTNNKNIKFDMKTFIKNSFKLTPIFSLNSHFDCVRKLTYLNKTNSLISVSDDYLIKIWNLKNLFYNSQYNDIYPFISLRGHTDSIFALEKSNDENIIYTAGKENLINIWNISNLYNKNNNDINNNNINNEYNANNNEYNYFDSETMFNVNIGFFQNNNNNENDSNNNNNNILINNNNNNNNIYNSEIIWNLKHHDYHNLLISLCSDGFINFWRTGTLLDYSNEIIDSKKFFLYKKKYKSNNNNNNNNIPTCCDFLHTNNNKLIVGFNNNFLSIFDINKKLFDNYFNLSTNNINNNRNIYNQPNCIKNSNTIPIIYTGNEDGTIKLLDLRNNSNSNIIKNLKIHSDSINNINIYKDLYIITISNDTFIKMFDLRNFTNSLLEIKGCDKKYEESNLDSIIIENEGILCVAGADSTIKLFKL